MIAENFYTFAEELLKDSDNLHEALLRTVVGRAYYAVYLSTRDWMDVRFARELSETEGNSHIRYTKCLMQLQRTHFDMALSKFARELTELKDKRHFADYCIDVEEVQDEINTKEAILQTKKLLNDLDALKRKYP